MLNLIKNKIQWLIWSWQERHNLKKINEIQSQGHSHHCACRQVWGDGECECDLYQRGYDPYAWTRGESPYGKANAPKLLLKFLNKHKL